MRETVLSLVDTSAAAANVEETSVFKDMQVRLVGMEENARQLSQRETEVVHLTERLHVAEGRATAAEEVCF